MIKILKNKHMLAAVIVTPILAILGYLAVDAFVSETPHAAVKGSQYELSVKSNCRYTSGQCFLQNGDFKLALIATKTDQQVLLKLASSHELDGVMIGWSGSDPAAMAGSSDSGLTWSIAMPLPETETTLQIVTLANDSQFFAEAPSTFIDYENAFGEDFRTEK